VLSDEDSDPRESALDHRVVAQEYLSGLDLVKDWEAPCFGRSDMWSRAEATMEQQKALSFGDKSFVHPRDAT